MNRSLLLFLMLAYSCNPASQKARWSLMLHRPGVEPTEVIALPENLTVPFSSEVRVGGVQVDFSLTPNGRYTVFRAVATAHEKVDVFFSLNATYTTGIPYNFNGPVDGQEIFRQSPHDVNAWIVTTIAEQAVPVVALQSADAFQVAVSGSPHLYDNFTSQAFYESHKLVSLRSGDDGRTPGLKPDTSRTLSMDYNADKQQIFSPGKVVAHYHPVGKGKSHVFEGLLFTSYASSLTGLRRDVNRYVAEHFSGGHAKDYFGALAFTTTFMNLRVNETGKSSLWIVPAVEYGNTQYGRDAFWMSMMLDKETSAACLQHELAAVNAFAEYPLFTVIWAYRLHTNGVQVDKHLVQAYVNAIEERVTNDRYHSYLASDGRLDFQYWGDLMAFDKDDVITYNQGLLAVALYAANEMGLEINSDPDRAAFHYRNMYNGEWGLFPVSEKKNAILSPDVLVGDLLSLLYFNQALLPDDAVRAHFERMTAHARTKYGFKVVCNPDGSYLSGEQYDVPGYVSQVNRENIPDGRYFRGGSYFLYDNLFLIDAYLHGIKEAEHLLRWRVSLDFQIGNTTYETINTKTGEPWKPNMGWNVAVYAIWKKLVEEGKASGRLFAQIDSVAKSHP